MRFKFETDYKCIIVKILYNYDYSKFITNKLAQITLIKIKLTIQNPSIRSKNIYFYKIPWKDNESQVNEEFPDLSYSR